METLIKARRHLTSVSLVATLAVSLTFSSCHKLWLDGNLST